MGRSLVLSKFGQKARLLKPIPLELPDTLKDGKINPLPADRPSLLTSEDSNVDQDRHRTLGLQQASAHGKVTQHA